LSSAEARCSEAITSLHLHLVKLPLKVDVVSLVNMLFGKKDRQPEEVADASPASVKEDSQSSTNSQPNTVAEVGADASKPKDIAGNPTDIVYPSGLKLALLLTSIFVSMFLVSLVC
jgi:hypothetical protein